MKLIELIAIFVSAPMVLAGYMGIIAGDVFGAVAGFIVGIVVFILCAVWLVGAYVYGVVSWDPVPFNEWLPMPDEFPGAPATWFVWVGLVALDKTLGHLRQILPQIGRTFS